MQRRSLHINPSPKLSKCPKDIHVISWEILIYSSCKKWLTMIMCGLYLPVLQNRNVVFLLLIPVFHLNSQDFAGPVSMAIFMFDDHKSRAFIQANNNTSRDNRLAQQ